MDTNIQVHLLPCSITVPDGVAEANVSKYFEPTIQSSSVHSSLGKEVLSASLRGRPLKGTPIQLPTGYHGVVLKEDKESLSGNILVQEKDRQRALSIDKTFSSFKYWTLDTQPSQDDKYLTTMKWINISDTLHQPIIITSSSEDCPSE